MDQYKTKVENIMTHKVVTLSPDDTLEIAAQFFEKYDFDGFPVIDNEHRLVGIVTAYEMILQSSRIHLPVVFGIVGHSSEDHERELKSHFEKIREIKIREIMNIDPLVIGPDVRVVDLAQEFAQHHRVNPIPVTDKERKIVGVVSRYDIIKFFNEKYLHEVLKGSDHSGVLRRLTRIAEEEEG